MFVSIWQDSLTILWGDWLDLRVRVSQVVASGLISPLIYILAFGLGLGSSMRGNSAFGGNYLAFILPGMVALSGMTISFGGTTFSICGDRLYSKTFEEMLMMPIHPLAMHIGKMLAGVIRGLLTSGSVIGVAILVTGNWRFLHPEFLLLLILNCMVFAGLGVIVGLSVQSLEAVGLYNNFIIVPMSFLGATFFDPSQLPTFAQVMIYALPLTQATVGMRAVVSGNASSWYSWVILIILAIALSGIGAYRFSHQQD
ncbi:ABC-type multidrug transport system, permease component [Synechococcus sp. PCC 7502]|nr:ABC transporter permease [Synechococcus sp. PCC 7502]AFY74588.1 ABC-type multidrug transport system, permease component [Synechococcus sp. PCC 7502]